jgi:8-oxo-dGTP pyrophosphatase MutT (NUDIX family)
LQFDKRRFALDPSQFNHLGNLTEQDIRERLRSEPQPPDVIPEPIINLPIVIRHRNAAVLVPLIPSPDGWQVLFTRRTDTVANHKGLVSFPGGALEPQDHGPAEAATREAWEEIGLPLGQTRICGYLDNLLEITGFLVTPVIGIIPWPFEVRHCENEVKCTFTIPLDWLADEKNYRIKHYEDRKNPALNRDVLFYDEYNEETVWGLTAYITIGLVQHLLQRKMTWSEIFEKLRNKS